VDWVTRSAERFPENKLNRPNTPFNVIGVITRGASSFVIAADIFLFYKGKLRDFKKSLPS
jgi:hypothetical protein